jgi:phenylalanine-4-hydroxylase
MMEAGAKPDLRSAYEKSGADDIDPRCIPQYLDHEPPVGSDVPYPDYPPLDHANWRHLFERQMAILPGRAGDAFFRGVEVLGMTPDRIPALSEMSERMEAATGWRIARIPGLLHEKDFFNLLSQRLFPSTDYIRGTDELDYTPAPDCFHDMFGHMPMLTHPAFGDFYHMFGQAALRAEGEDRIRLERLHWFTVEFGLIQQADGNRIFGAGILSSKNEAAHALSESVEVRPFDTHAVTTQDYDVWHLQPTLFALESFDQLVSEFRKWTRERNLL